MTEIKQDNDHNEPVIELERDGVFYTLLGTAHVSRTSAETVTRLIENGEYDAVSVELCENRHQALTADKRWTEMNLFKILREGKAGMIMASLALSGYQRRIADQLGIEPGAEMRAAIQAAAGTGASLQLIDRDLATTLKRVYRSISFWRRFLLLSGLIGSSFSSEEIAEEDIEKLKQGDLLEATFNEFAEQTPEIYRTLISERDEFMAARLREENTNAEGRRVLVVVGAGHLAGLAKYLQEDTNDPVITQQKLNHQPKPARWPRLIPWLIMVLIISGFAIGFMRSPELGWRLVAIWVLINGTLAALGALLARAHPLTVISAFLAAPLTSLNPTIAAGMVTGLMEAWLREPKISDFERLRDDVTQLSGWFKNPATRVLLVFFFSNIGSSIGTWVAGFQIFEKLS
jgi:pheromone shutdown-related protein TraB